MKPQDVAGTAPISLWVLDGAMLETVTPDAMRSVLAADEIERARHYCFEDDARRFSSSRYWLRRILAWHLRTSPQKIEFHYGAYGKPCVDVNHRLHFSLSHVEGMTLIALSGAPVGVDVEIVSRWPSRACAPPYFRPDELAWINGVPKGEQTACCSLVWTAKEARLKASGEGIRGIEHIGVYPCGTGALAYTLPAGAPLDTGWLLLPLCLPAGYVGAVAIQACETSVSYRHPHEISQETEWDSNS